MPSIDIFQPTSSGALVASRTILRDSRTASGALAQICSASLIASSRAWPGSTSRFTSPKWWARAASIGSPVRASSMAMLSGILRPSRNRPPAAATSDRFTSGMPNVAVVDATTRSQASTISVPPARAGPSTAAITGLVRSRWTKPANPPRFVDRRARVAGVDLLEVGAGAEHRRLPGEDADPDRVVGLERSMASSMPLATAPLTALRASGRLILMTAKGPRCSKSTDMAGTLARWR